MTLSDLETVLDWAAAEGWNPGLEDAAAFWAADPDGFFLAEQDGRLAAAISVVNHDADHAFLGLYICHPDFRGQGIGLALWTHALSHAETRSIGLDGVPAQQANYARAGFVATGSTLRLEGSVRPAPWAQDPPPRLSEPGGHAALLALDRAALGHARPAFLSNWITQTPTRRTVVANGPEGPVGFATARLCRSGGKIGPVIAPDTATALALIAGAAQALDLDRIAVDVPQQNAALLEALDAAGFVETFRTARMVRGTPPVQSGSLQAVATLELG
ncbi:GNAT family N-acetyltransferase [Frigidibacter sp.]|uniref:GNAT family N-acetyltransferase n=1 Tax=Frigidibacter sp. TaxID=2586418 RepID=UPI002737440F|nr:GNAT family N-acetyltransferase [Frigidibacter sp.]MDP3340534.1 GNAT family N-acetyltransferase [Frigidibacter sp.]